MNTLLPSDRRATRRSVGVWLIGLLLWAAAPAAAQPALPAWADASVTVVPGARYGVGSSLRAVLGGRYRDLWTTPIAVPVLSLRRFAGGLTPVRAHTGSQTQSLRLEGADGRTYQFRSIDKNPVTKLTPELQASIIARVLQDGVSSAHPAASLVTSALLEAAGVLHVKQTLVVLPDDPALGEFRSDFAGVLGMIEERPDEDDQDLVSFAGARRVISPTRLFERIDASPDDRVDARAFLEARLVDMVVGDRDRHRDQFRWATFDDRAVRHWRPISRDHDWAFARIDGVALAMARVYYPPLVTFEADYPPHDKLNWHSREIDRRFLSGLDRPDWSQAAERVRDALTDAVLEAAVREMPPEMYRVGGADLLAMLTKRRDALFDEALSYYAFLAREVEIRATDAREVAEITWLDDDTVDVVIRERKDGVVPYFHRRFTDRDTREIRIKMWGRDDQVITKGDGRASITVRVVGGRGDDEFVGTGGADRLRLYDDAGHTRTEMAPGVRVDETPYQEWVGSDLNRYPPREWGVWWRPIPWFAVSSDVGVLAGGGFIRTRYGFRKSPYASNIVARLGYSTAIVALKAEFDGEFRWENASPYWELHALASGVEVLRYYGLGNESDATRGADFHRVRFQQYRVAPAIAFPIGSVKLSGGPVVAFSNTHDGDGRYFTDLAPTLYGAGRFGQIGAQGRVSWDTRDEPAHPRRGSLIAAEVRAFPAVWDVARPYGTFAAEAATYRPLVRAGFSTLALRIRAQQNVGTFPFQESAFLGGPSSLRGYVRERFAGDASLLGNAEWRVTAGRLPTLVPGEWGVFAHADAGRVWVDGVSDGPWHSSLGGGLWVSIIERAHTFRIGISRGREGTSFYLGAGMAF